MILFLLTLAIEAALKIIAVIPARYDSSRFPGKMLARNTGKYLIQHTWERVRQSRLISEVYIAVDDDRIMQACRQFGAEGIMTDRQHPSGTDRIAQAIQNIAADIVLNIQGDEPEIDPQNIDMLAQLLIDHPQADMATLVARFADAASISNPNIVKVVIDKDRYAKYFSRSVIPYDRNGGGVGNIANYLRHIGIYAYRREFLLKITKLPPTMLEQAEKLEQLRAIECGYSILTALVSHCCDGIDTPEQYDKFVTRYLEKK